jgi:hypothetical protein
MQEVLREYLKEEGRAAVVVLGTRTYQQVPCR